MVKKELCQDFLKQSRRVVYHSTLKADRNGADDIQYRKPCGKPRVGGDYHFPRGEIGNYQGREVTQQCWSPISFATAGSRQVPVTPQSGAENR